jgi:hypothetical protein
MARKREVHVVPRSGGWAIEASGLQSGATYSTQKEAAQIGRQLARQQETEFVLHGRDGKIRQKTSYGNDPRSSRG